jgi:RND family efflux transporter MFP subunit
MSATRCLFGVAVFAGLALMAAGCDGGGGPGGWKKEAPRVTVATPLQKKVTEYGTFTGRLAAEETVEIRSRVSGYLDRVEFKEGDEVQKGAKLFVIDRRPYEAEKEKAEGALAQADADHRNKKSQLERAVKQFNKGAISAEEYTTAIANEATAAAAVEVSKASLKTAKLNLDYTIVTAPITGRISKFNVTPGNLVVADSTLLTTMVSVDPIYAYFDVDELTVQRIKELIRQGKFQSANEEGAVIPVELGLSTEKGFPHQGVLNFVDVRVDANTGTLRVRGVFPNPPAGPTKTRMLVPGYFCRVRIAIGEPYEALMVPERALQADQGQKYLLLVDSKNVVQFQPVELGVLEEGLRAITDGLKAEDRVIINGLQRVRPGDTVDPQPGKIVPEPDRAAGPAAAAGMLAPKLNGKSK